MISSAAASPSVRRKLSDTSPRKRRRGPSFVIPRKNRGATAPLGSFDAQQVTARIPREQRIGVLPHDCGGRAIERCIQRLSVMARS